jgi:RNA polymerase sigma-70 factor, ECF subfamily
MNLRSELPDEELLLRMEGGDEDAFTTLYRRRQGGIYRFALQMTGNAGVAEEITQETFLMLIRHPNRFDPARGSLAAFLFGVARNLILRSLDREQPYVGHAGAPDNDATQPVRDSGTSVGVDSSERYERAQLIEQVRRAVSSLPAIYREVVVLCELEEITYEDAAVALGCAVGTVRSRLHRGRALLMEKLLALHPAQSNLNARSH